MEVEQTLSRYMTMGLQPGEDFLEELFTNSAMGEWNLQLVMGSYCFSQDKMLAAHKKNALEMKEILLVFLLPTEIPYLCEAIKSELSLLTIWTTHVIQMYEDFFSDTDEKKTIFFWRQYRDYLLLKRFVASEPNSLIAEHHGRACLKPTAELLTRIGREILTESSIREALEEEAQFGENEVEVMKATLTELQLWRGEKDI